MPMDARRKRLLPLVLATMASQALLVVLSPTMAAIGEDLDASVSAVGQARSITGAVAVATSLAIAARIGAVGVPRLLALGAWLGVLACAAVALASSLGMLLAAHVLVGVALACLLTGGFAGVAAFPPGDRAWAIGYVAGANAVAWIVVNPLVGGLADWLTWRAAEGVPGALAIAALLSARSAAPVPGTGARLPLRALVGDTAARRWICAELIAYGAWTGLLTFVGAFFVERLDVGEAAAGWLLAAGAAAYVGASTRSKLLIDRVPRRSLVAGSALVMAALLPVLLGLDAGAAAAAGVFCLIGATAGVRTPVSSGLGLDQLPRHPDAMMAARTAVTQLGYLIGAVVGGAVIAIAGYSALGGVLAVGMAISALLVLRVRDPLDRRPGSRAVDVRSAATSCARPPRPRRPPPASRRPA
jgi:predicted MFS family arabinose efflux permease